MAEVTLSEILRLIAEQMSERCSDFLEQAADEIERLQAVEKSALSLALALHEGQTVGQESDWVKLILREAHVE